MALGKRIAAEPRHLHGGDEPPTDGHPCTPWRDLAVSVLIAVAAGLAAAIADAALAR